MKFRRSSAFLIALILAAAPLAFGQTAHDAARLDRGNGRIASNSLAIGANAINFNGNYSYSYTIGGSCTLKADNVTNTNATATGPLRFALWFTTAPWPSGGYIGATYQFTNSLAAGATLTNISGSGPFTQAPTGCYNVTFVLEEQVSGTWTARDYGGFAKTADNNGGCITSFTASPSTIPSGGTSTLSWTTIGTVNAVTIDQGLGTLPANGSKAVTPSATTTYTLTSQNTTPAGQKFVTVTVQQATPTITSLTPSHGPASGGNNVTISGTNLTGATSVTFGGAPATLGVNNGTSLAVVAPPHAAGTVTLQVTTPNGSATAQYTYDAASAPTISSISPSSGPTAGGQTVTITGANFGTGNVVTFDTSTAAILAATSTSLVVRTPPHAAGNVTVSVTMPTGTATTQYTYSESMRIVSVVGSTAGSFGSFFRTAMQLHNDSSASVTGTMVFHPSGAPAGPNDPSLPFTLTPGQTKSIDDLVASLNTSGVGSLDINSDNVGSILFSSRIYNDAGAAGTTGMSIDPLAPSDALQQNDVALLLVPADSGARFNVGVRSLSAGATLNVSLYTADGTLRTSTSHTYDTNAFAQTDAASFAGVAPNPNETIVITVSAGSAIVYGAMTDNKTQDPTYQPAKSLAALRARGQVAKLVVPVVGSVAGSFNSFFRTSMQLHNAGTSPINGSIIFHPQATSGSSSDPSMTYTLAAGQTISYSDVVSSIHTSGIGSLDITSSDFTSLLVLARIYNDAGANGTTGMGLTAMAPGDALQPGQTGVLLAPAHVDVFRYNVGVRSLDAGASVQFTVIDSNGNTKATSTKTFTPNFFQQYGAADLLGTAVAANDAILISVNSGSVVVYGSTTDNRTQDPTYAVARAE